MGSVADQVLTGRSKRRRFVIIIALAIVLLVVVIVLFATPFPHNYSYAGRIDAIGGPSHVQLNVPSGKTVTVNWTITGFSAANVAIATENSSHNPPPGEVANGSGLSGVLTFSTTAGESYWIYLLTPNTSIRYTVTYSQSEPLL